MDRDLHAFMLKGNCSMVEIEVKYSISIGRRLSSKSSDQEEWVLFLSHKISGRNLFIRKWDEYVRIDKEHFENAKINALNIQSLIKQNSEKIKQVEVSKKGILLLLYNYF